MTFPGALVSKLHHDHHRWDNLPWYWKNWVVLTRLHEAGGILIFFHRLAIQVWPDLRSQILQFWDMQIAHTGTLTKTWREEIDKSKSLALAWLQTVLRWGQQTASGDLTWPDLTRQLLFVKMCAMNVYEKSPSMSFQSCGVWQWHKKTWRGP